MKPSLSISLFFLALLAASGCGGNYKRSDESTAGHAGADEAAAGNSADWRAGTAGSSGARTLIGGASSSGGAGERSVNAAGASDGSASAGAGGAGSSAGAATAGSAGMSPRPTSCDDLPVSCGPNNDEDCCTSLSVPHGSFTRHANGQAFPASVSDFELDRYEITVGRFRHFLAVYSRQLIPAGAGKNPHNPADSGWDPAWNASLPEDAAALDAALSCGDNYQTWSARPGDSSSENRPLTCLSWFEAEAFCIWDNGRLPTDAEWTYAASGGAEQRLYPWGNAAPDCTYANFFGASDGTDFCVLPGVGAPNPVGSESPKGDGKWGQADLGGNISEWVQDYAHVFPDQCQDCATLTPSTTSGNRVVKGGSFAENGQVMQTGFRVSGPGTAQVFGARCARAPAP